MIWSLDTLRTRVDLFLTLQLEKAKSDKPKQKSALIHMCKDVNELMCMWNDVTFLFPLL